MSADTRLYDLLGVTPEATARSIQRAYQKTLDELGTEESVDDPDAIAELQQVKAAYEILKNETTRKIYNKYGQIGVNDYRLGFHNEPYEYHGKETIMSRLENYIFNEEAAIKLQDWIPTLFDNQDMFDYLFEFWNAFKERANDRLVHLLFDFMNHTEGKSDLSFHGHVRHHLSPKLQTMKFVDGIVGELRVPPNTELITIQHIVCAHVGLDLNNASLERVNDTTISISYVDLPRPGMSLDKLLSLRLDPRFFFERLSDASDPIYSKILKRLKSVQFTEQPDNMCDKQLDYYLDTIAKTGTCFDDEFILSLVMKYRLSKSSQIERFIEQIDSKNYLPEDRTAFIAYAMAQRLEHDFIVPSVINIYMKTCEKVENDLMCCILEKIEKPVFDILLGHLRAKNAIIELCFALLKRHTFYSKCIAELFEECGEHINDMLEFYMKNNAERSAQASRYVAFAARSSHVKQEMLIVIFKYVFEESQYYTKQDLMKMIKPFRDIMLSDEILPTIEFYNLVYAIVHVDPNYESNSKFVWMFDALEEKMKANPMIYMHFSLILPVEVTHDS